MTAPEKVEAIQKILGVKPDRIWGPITQEALDDLLEAAKAPHAGVHRGMASSFADPRDITSFKKCKATGKSDAECFKVGDNGVGVWGDDTTVDKPYCAIPRDDWQQFGGAARGKKVKVTVGGKSIICELRDTMPWKRNIKNGAIIDLNPGALKLLGLAPPIMRACEWEWAS